MCNRFFETDFKCQKHKKLALELRIQTLTNDDEVCIASLSSILLAAY